MADAASHLARRGAPCRPYLIGGHQEDGRRAGTENVIGIAGFGAAAEAVYVRVADYGSFDGVSVWEMHRSATYGDGHTRGEPELNRVLRDELGDHVAPWTVLGQAPVGVRGRSEERRVGKEGRSRWSPDH